MNDACGKTMVYEYTARTFDPSRADFTPYGLTCVHWRPSPMRRPDHHNEIELNFVVTGSLTYLLGSNKIEIFPGRLTCFWAAIPHQVIGFCTGTVYYVVTIPLSWFLHWRLPEYFAQMLLQGNVVQEQTINRQESDCERLSGWEQDLAKMNPEIDEVVLMEMQARLARLALETPRAANLKSIHSRRVEFTAAQLTRAEQMACYVAQNYVRPLSVQDIADQVKFHPNYAMNLFRKTFGTTLITYLTKHRVSHAQRLLTTTRASVAEIALVSGFNSVSRFNDAFRRACGCSPREYRRSHVLK